MFSLWDESKKFTNLKLKDKPSPANSKETGLFRKNISQIQNQIYFIPTKRIPRLTLCMDYMMTGAMSVEASFLLPLFLLFVLTIFSCVEMMRLGSNVSYALWRIGSVMTTYDALSPEDVGEGLVASSWVQACGLVTMQAATAKVLGEEYLETSPLRYGAAGLNFLSSEFCDQSECVDIAVTYQVRPTFSVFPFPYTRMANRYYGRVFTGYDVTKKQEMVYVAEYGTVWHASAECSYIYIPYVSVEMEQIADLRTSSGAKYTPCANCKREPKTEKVYITRSGDSYHLSDKCSSLHRHVTAIWKEEIGELSPCSKCAKEKKGCT